MKNKIYHVNSEIIQPGRAIQYRIESNGNCLSYSSVLDLWRGDVEFCRYFTGLLADAPFGAFRWETPPITRETVGRDFEFVLLNAPGFARRRTDDRTYRIYFTDNEDDSGVVSFSNLSGDAKLVVPSPRTGIEAYGHLAAFTRDAPESQTSAFWGLIAEVIGENLRDRPIWLNTAGGGVAWLHARLDSRPKYYGFAPYKTVK